MAITERGKVGNLELGRKQRNKLKEKERLDKGREVKERKE